MIRCCNAADIPEMAVIINDAAIAYKGVIPPDRWHDPYMPEEELRREIAAGIEFMGYEEDGALLGVMGIQDKGEVELIRHAYVRTNCQKHGIGSKLLRHLQTIASKPILIGTWEAATWAIGLYQRHGYQLIADREEKKRLLDRFWGVPERQVETSVVLADAQWFSETRRKNG